MRWDDLASLPDPCKLTCRFVPIVQRLGLRLFKPVTRVRLPLGMPSMDFASQDLLAWEAFFMESMVIDRVRHGSPEKNALICPSLLYRPLFKQ